MSISNYISDGPYIRSYNKQNIIENITSNSCTGFIDEVTLDGGTSPYNINWAGPSGYTATTLNIYDLCAGTYSGTVTDSIFSANTSFIVIETQPEPALSATTTNSGCTTNINDFCTIKVHSFEHDQGEFTYILYQDGVPYKTYVGLTGNEEHTFSNLPAGNYTLTAYDGIEVDTTYLNSNGTCSDDYFLNSSIFGGTGVVFTGLTPSDILTGWDKVIKYSHPTFVFPVAYGPNFYSGFGFTIRYDSGYKKDGSIEVDNPDAWFYTGTTATRRTDGNTDWYLGTLSTPMTEGANVGPGGLAALSDIGKFYYNTTINKFLYNWLADGISNSWVTFNPTQDYGIDGNPVASQLLTAATRYTTSAALGDAQKDYTVTGGTNDVIAWNGVASDVFQLTGNNNIPINVMSDCKYCNYTHEVTMGATGTDNDNIGIVLAGFRDELGLYGEVNHTHTLTLYYNTQGGVAANVSIRINTGDSRHGFSSGIEEVRYCGDFSSPCTDALLTESSLVGSRPITNSPFSVGTYGSQGTTRVKIERSGTLGEIFRIQMTDVMVLADVGTPNAYNPAYEWNLNLLNKTTWTGETSGAPAYADNFDLVRFLGAQSVGYLQSSQPATRFYHIALSGTQCGDYTVGSGYGSSATRLFPLYNSNFFGIDMSKNITNDYTKSLGGGGRIGKPTVPWVNPGVKATMETIIDPTVEMTKGGGKITDSVDKYVIYDPSIFQNIEGDDTPITLSFKWYKNITNMLNEDVKAYYTIHPFNYIDNKFDINPITGRIIDSGMIDSYSLREDWEVNGEALSFTDIIDFEPADEVYQYLIKTNYISKSKIQNLEVGTGNLIIPPTDCPPEDKYNTWWDTSFVSSDDPNNVLGIYNEETDFIFNVLPPEPEINLLTNSFDYGNPLACSSLNIQQAIVKSASGTTTGDTIVPFLMADKPFTIVLELPAQGQVQVTLNGLTLFPGTFVGDADYFRDGDVFTFPANVLSEDDVLQFIYGVANTPQSYEINRILVPATVPVVTGTYDTVNTIYTNGLNYYVQLYPIPRGAIGVALNGVVLQEGGDFKRLNNNTLQLLNITYPGGLDVNDVLTTFYFTDVTLTGIAFTKNPIIMVEVNNMSFIYSSNAIFTVYDSDGNVVQKKEYPVTRIVEEDGSLKTGTNAYGFPVTGLGTVECKVVVPEPGTYTYNVEIINDYPLVMKRASMFNSKISPTYSFEIKPDIFYLAEVDDNDGDSVIVY